MSDASTKENEVLQNLKILQKYFSEVLGVREVLITSPTLLQESDFALKLQSKKIIFLDEKDKRTEEGKKLLEKMIAAMRLPESQTLVLEIDIKQISENLSEIESAKAVVCFSKSLEHFIENNFPRVNLKSTYSPEELLAHPEYKREVWELLKTLI